MTTIQSLIDKYSQRSEALTPISADEVLADMKVLQGQEIRGWYQGENITSHIRYAVTKEKLQAKVEFISFMAGTTVDPKSEVEMFLYIRFKDGTEKRFYAPEEFTQSIFVELLKQADDYLSTIDSITKTNKL